jgi:hypothetical protein
VAGHEAWVGWLRRTKWDWFVTLTYSARANGGSADGIRRDAQEWIEALRAKCPRVYAACSFERGPHLGGWHCHVLLGGLGSHPAHREFLSSLWRRHGPVSCDRYDPLLDPGTASRGACAYLVKEWPNAEVEIVGRLRKHRPRVSKAPERY